MSSYRTTEWSPDCAHFYPSRHNQLIHYHFFVKMSRAHLRILKILFLADSGRSAFLRFAYCLRPVNRTDATTAL